MKKRIIILSLVSMLVLGLFTGCYTSFGTVRHYNVYDDEVVYYDDDDSATAIKVYHHYRPYYPTKFVYYDPYDYWYDEPIIYISVGYNYRPHYYVTYYPYGGCIYPGWYPIVYYPHHVPIWYYEHNGYYAHHNNYRNYYDYKKRDFAKRRSLPGSDYGRRDRRDGFSKPGIGNKYANDDVNYGRRQIAQRNTDIGDADIRNISRRNDEISKRNVQAPQEKPVKTKQVRRSKEDRSADIINRNLTSKERSVTIKGKKASTGNTSIPKVVKRKQVTTKKYDVSSNKNSNPSKQRNTSGSIRESRNSNSSSSDRSSNRSRPSVREKSKSSSSSQSKSSGASRSSYTPSKSSSKSSSSSARSSYSPSKSNSNSSSGSSKKRSRR
jgi:hypothetical protein